MNYSQLIDLVYVTKHNEVMVFSNVLKNDLMTRNADFKNEQNDVDFYIYHKDLQSHNYSYNLRNAIIERFQNDVKYFDEITDTKYINYQDIIFSAISEDRKKLWDNLHSDLINRYAIHIQDKTRPQGTPKYKDETKKTEFKLKSVYECKNIVIVTSNYNIYDLRNGYENTTDYLKKSFIKTVRFNRFILDNDIIDEAFNGVYLYAMERYNKSLDIDSKYFGKFNNFNHAFFYTLRVIKMLSVKLDTLDFMQLINSLLYTHKRKTLNVKYDNESIKNVVCKMQLLNRIECKADYKRIINSISYYYSSKYMLEIVNNYAQLNCKDVYKKAVSRMFEKYGKLFNVSFNVLSKAEKTDFLYSIYRQCLKNEYAIKNM